MQRKIEVGKRSVVLCVLFALVASAGADAAGSEDGEVIEMTDFGMPQFPDLVGAPHLRCVAPVGDVVAAQTSAMSAGRRAAAEVVRLMDVIDEKRCGIDTERATELQSVAKAYQDKLQAIAPKDMFESDAEYHARSAREKSEIELQRVASINDVHRTYDDRLRQEVEPLIQRVEELLSSEDIVPRDAIEFHLETYDAESQLFHGILKIDSPIVPTDALIHFPMKRADARVFWGNRQSLIPRVRVSLALWSLSTDLNRFGLDDPESGMTARVFVVPRPPAGQPPSGKAGVVSGFKESARALAERAPEVTRTDSAKGVIAEYNRLIGEAKGVFVSDAFVQSLREIAYHGSVWQSAGEVATAAGGLHAYLTSFASSDGFKESARALAERAPEVTRTDSAKGVIAEYNRLIGEAKGVFVSDAFVQSLREIAYHGSVWQSAGEVATAAGGLHAYLTSFASSDGFKESARALAERAPEVTRTDSAKGVIAEYNRLIGEAKGVFVSDASVQGLREIRYQGNVRQAAEAVASAASSLGRIVANMSDVPITFEITEKPSRGQEFDYLPYSGRFSGNVRSLAKWLRRDFSLLLKDEYGYTDLHHAATENLPGLVSALLDAGASANVRSATNYAPLHFAATALIAADLIAGGATVNAMTDLGWTPLMVAAWKRNHAIAEFLIGQGANVNLKHGDGWTALDFALHRGASDVAELLKRHGGTCNEKC